MNARVGGHLEACKERGIEDRRNGSYSRRLLMGVGDVELRVPRTRTYIPLMGLERYARGAPEIDRLILAAFVLGLSTRKVGKALLHLLGESVSASTVSKGARQLDAEVAAWHRRRLSERYRVLMFDGVALSRKTGAGAIRRPVLVALGIRPDGKKEVIDFRLAQGESQAAWETFPNELYNRGLEAGEVELAVSDGGKGLLAALALCLSAPARATLLGAQAAQCPGQGAQNRSRGGQGRSATNHERFGYPGSPKSRRCLHPQRAGPLSESRSLSGRRSRCPFYTLSLQRAPMEKGIAQHQRHRTPLRRGAPKNPSHGRDGRPGQHGTHPLCRLQRHQPKPRNRHPFSSDT